MNEKNETPNWSHAGITNKQTNKQGDRQKPRNNMYINI